MVCRSILEKAKPVLAKTTTKDVKGKPKGKQTVQAKSKEKIRKEDLTSEGIEFSYLFYFVHIIVYPFNHSNNYILFAAGPSDNYWQRLAENLQRRLDGKIEENADLKEENKRQKRQINQMQRQLEEAKNIISTFEELLNEDSNGINNSLDDTC